MCLKLRWTSIFIIWLFILNQIFIPPFNSKIFIIYKYQIFMTSPHSNVLTTLKTTRGFLGLPFVIFYLSSSDNCWAYYLNFHTFSQNLSFIIFFIWNPKMQLFSYFIFNLSYWFNIFVTQELSYSLLIFWLGFVKVLYFIVLLIICCLQFYLSRDFW